MSKSRYNQNFDLECLSKKIILLHGVFETSFYDLIAKREDAEFFVLEGRPDLKGSQRSCRELLKRGIRPTLISDNMAGFFFLHDCIREVWLAYHEADQRGAMCFIGASILGVLSRKHQIPVFCYPTDYKSEFLGKAKDVCFFNGIKVAPPKTEVYVPLMEWVPGTCLGVENE